MFRKSIFKGLFGIFLDYKRYSRFCNRFLKDETVLVISSHCSNHSRVELDQNWPEEIRAFHSREIIWVWMCAHGTTALDSGSTQLWVQLNPSLEVLLVHTKDQVMHSYMSPPISAVSQVYILPRFLLVQVWSMNFRILRLRNTQKQKKMLNEFQVVWQIYSFEQKSRMYFRPFLYFLFILFKFFDKDGIIFFFRHFRDVKIFVNIRA